MTRAKTLPTMLKKEMPLYVAVASIALVLIEGDNLSVPRVLRVQLCPVLVDATPGSLQTLAPGSPKSLQIPLAGCPLVLERGDALGFSNGGHLGRLGFKPVV